MLGLLLRFPSVRSVVGDIVGGSVAGPGMSCTGLEVRALILGGAAGPQVCVSADVCLQETCPIGPKELDGLG